MDLSGISVSVEDCLDQDQTCIFMVAKMFGKKYVSIGNLHATKLDLDATRSIHFTLIDQ